MEASIRNMGQAIHFEPQLFREDRQVGRRRRRH